MLMPHLYGTTCVPAAQCFHSFGSYALVGLGFRVLGLRKFDKIRTLRLVDLRLGGFSRWSVKTGGSWSVTWVWIVATAFVARLEFMIEGRVG